MTEKELTAELIYCLLKNGGEGLSFEPIVVSGPNTSLPHGVPGERKLQEGDFITMDFGVLYQGYCSDMTRTVALGYATEEMKKVYDTVLAAQLAGIAATRAGVTGKSIDAAARQVICDAGYGAFFGHGYGHSLGLEIHESPNCNPAEERIMEENMVCSAEPGIYLPGKFGVRIEDVVVFTASGCEILTASPKNLIII
jgi:Xaa-Pro aminopeptidase